GADRLVGFEGDSLVFHGKAAGAEKAKIPLADLISVRLDDQDLAAFAAAAKKTPAAAQSGSSSGPRFRVEILPADHVTASLAGWGDSRLTLALDGLPGSALSVPVERVRAIWSTNESKVKEAKDLKVSAESQDVAFVDSEGKVKSVSGVATGIEKEFLKFKFEGEERKIKLERLVGVLLAQRELPGEKSLFESLTLSSGDVVSGRIQSLVDGLVRMAPLAPAGDAASLELPLARVSSIDVKNGRLTWLSELTPKSVEQTPYFDRLMPYRVDTSLTGGQLVLNDGPVTRGIAVHSKCALEYEIGGGFDRLRAKVGFQQPEGKLGRAPVRIRGNGKLLWEEANLTGEAKKPALVDLDIAGVKTLVLEADFGPDGDVGGRVIWGDARLIKAAAK
ncbi:MAG TPA: NPCBM/NEW2 domain-containing protein, partial [Pirellulales bacterium]